MTASRLTATDAAGTAAVASALNIAPTRARYSCSDQDALSVIA